MWFVLLLTIRKSLHHAHFKLVCFNEACYASCGGLFQAHNDFLAISSKRMYIVPPTQDRMFNPYFLKHLVTQIAVHSDLPLNQSCNGKSRQGLHQECWQLIHSAQTGGGVPAETGRRKGGVGLGLFFVLNLQFIQDTTGERLLAGKKNWMACF